MTDTTPATAGHPGVFGGQATIFGPPAEWPVGVWYVDPANPGPSLYGEYPPVDPEDETMGPQPPYVPGPGDFNPFGSTPFAPWTVTPPGEPDTEPLPPIAGDSGPEIVEPN